MNVNKQKTCNKDLHKQQCGWHHGQYMNVKCLTFWCVDQILLTVLEKIRTIYICIIITEAFTFTKNKNNKKRCIFVDICES